MRWRGHCLFLKSARHADADTLLDLELMHALTPGQRAMQPLTRSRLPLLRLVNLPAAALPPQLNPPTSFSQADWPPSAICHLLRHCTLHTAASPAITALTSHCTAIYGALHRGCILIDLSSSPWAT